MLLRDNIGFAISALHGYRLRTGLMLLAMTIAVLSILILTAMGEGARRYVIKEFSSLGTHLLIVLPGRSETTGGAPPMMADTPRDLTIEDALALKRSRYVGRVAPLAFGQAAVAVGGLERESTIMGSTAEMLPIRNFAVAKGRFLPAANPDVDSAICVLGKTVAKELFSSQSPLGKWVRIGERRFRVIGVLSDQGQSLASDVTETVLIPVASAQTLFNSYSLFRILVQAKDRSVIEKAKADVERILQERHDGEQDVTVITQDALLSTFDRILTALTFAVGGIAAISLFVAGILIMNVMLISVSQRTSEIGLLAAIGASPRQIQQLFLIEAALLSLAGAALGLTLGYSGEYLAVRLFPEFPIAIPLWASLAASGVSVATGLVFGISPARHAARLDPVQALSGRRG